MHGGQVDIAYVGVMKVCWPQLSIPSLACQWKQRVSTALEDSIAPYRRKTCVADVPPMSQQCQRCTQHNTAVQHEQRESVTLGGLCSHMLLTMPMLVNLWSCKPAVGPTAATFPACEHNNVGMSVWLGLLHVSSSVQPYWRSLHAGDNSALSSTI